MIADAASWSTPDASSRRGKMAVSLPKVFEASRSSSIPEVTRSTSSDARVDSAAKNSSSPPLSGESLAPRGIARAWWGETGTRAKF